MSGPFGSSQWMYQSAAGFYPTEIDQSLRFNDDDSAYLSRTPASAGNRKTWTWSGWVKRGNVNTSFNMLNVGDGSGFVTAFRFTNEAVFQFQDFLEATYNLVWGSSAVFRDPSAWYHVVFAYDSTQATSSAAATLWVNGVQQTLGLTAYTGSYSQNRDAYINDTRNHTLGRYYGSAYADGYMAEVNFIDGQALDPTDFGEFKSGVWVAKSYAGSYGTNGFYLNFSDSANIGDDLSGNANDWTANNLVATDVVLDSPTQNWCVLNPLNKGSIISLQEGNLEAISTNTASRGITTGTIGVSSGKWYYEAVIGTERIAIGFVQQPVSLNETVGYDATGYGYNWGANKINNNVSTSYGATFTTGDIIGVALDLDAGTIAFYKNGVSQGTAFTGLSGEFFPAIGDGSGGGAASAVVNFGQDSSFAGNKTPQGNTDDNGVGDFYYSPPSGYLALCTANLPDPAIDPAQDDVPADYFNTVLYTGNGSTQSITGVGFQPSWTWIKARNFAGGHVLVDTVRGTFNSGGVDYYGRLFSNNTEAENVSSIDTVTALNPDGFSVNSAGGGSYVNDTGDGYAAWNWLAGNGTSSNTSGSISSTVSVNEKAGFSVVSYTGNGTAGATVGHGLGANADVVFIKGRDNTSNWVAWHRSIGDNARLHLNTTDAVQSNTNFVRSANSTTFTMGTAANNNSSGLDYIAYCFAEVEGYSKFGSYTGNGSTDGPMIFTGHAPAFLIIKRTDSADDWSVYDNTRSPYNQRDELIYANSSNAETVNDTGHAVDFLSNGFKCRGTSAQENANGGTYIYMAFAENPFKYANAR